MLRIQTQVFVLAEQTLYWTSPLTSFMEVLLSTKGLWTTGWYKPHYILKSISNTNMFNAECLKFSYCWFMLLIINHHSLNYVFNPGALILNSVTTVGLRMKQPKWLEAVNSLDLEVADWKEARGLLVHNCPKWMSDLTWTKELSLTSLIEASNKQILQ